MKKPLSQFQRQIHLDFHTSPFIPDVGADFDADEFAQTLADARVNSVTVFAKCHHGMCYYPTQTGTPHPALNGRDLLGEQLEALHKRGIRAPIYTTIVWEEDAAARFPQWRQMAKDGTFAGTSMATDNSGAHPGAWKWLNFLNLRISGLFRGAPARDCRALRRCGGRLFHGYSDDERARRLERFGPQISPPTRHDERRFENAKRL